MKKITKNEEDQFHTLLTKAERQCQAEYRLGATTSFARCPERHLEPSQNPGRRGLAQLSLVQSSRTKKLFCQWCARAVLENLTYTPKSTRGGYAGYECGAGGVV